MRPLTRSKMLSWSGLLLAHPLCIDYIFGGDAKNPHSLAHVRSRLIALQDANTEKIL